MRVDALQHLLAHHVTTCWLMQERDLIGRTVLRTRRTTDDITVKLNSRHWGGAPETRSEVKKHQKATTVQRGGHLSAAACEMLTSIWLNQGTGVSTSGVT